jgi:hypothetical protein
LSKVFASRIVEASGACGRVQVEAQLLGAQRPRDLDSRPAAQRDRLRPASELRTGRLQAGHCSARQLRQRRLALAQLVVDHAELTRITCNASATSVVLRPWRRDELDLAVGVLHVHTIQQDRVKARVKSQVGSRPLD